MKIGLDWDGTVNAAPETFKRVVESFLDDGHEVTVTTWRSEPPVMAGWDREPGGIYPDMEDIFNQWGFRLPVVYCDGRAKRECYQADVWIDDNPAAVVFSLLSEPRFEANPLDYDKDELVLEHPDHAPIRVTWGQIKPQTHQLATPVNYQKEEA